jgi:hypothetical protein
MIIFLIALTHVLQSFADPLISSSSLQSPAHNQPTNQPTTPLSFKMLSSWMDLLQILHVCRRSLAMLWST